jgi:multidrug efflux pump subunit AcrB
VVIYANPNSLSLYNFSPLRVIEKVTQFNTFIPAGDVKIGNWDYQILSNALVDKPEEMNDFPLRSENGVRVYLNQIGRAEDAKEIQTNVVLIDGKEQVYVPVYRQPGANSLEIVDDMRRALKKLSALKDGFTFNLVGDQSVFIRHAIHSIAEEAMVGGGLAALLVFLFLGDAVATFGVVISLSLSLLCAFIGLSAVGETLNAMTLGGLALCIGVLVDNSIVVLENISKKLDQGKTSHAGALEGASEVAMPVLASTLATIIVFIPVVFLKGITKILFSSLAKSVVFAMIGSYFAAMAVVPLFAAHALKGGRTEAVARRQGLLPFIRRAVEALTRLYRHHLDVALEHRALVLGGCGALLVGGFLLAGRVGTELFPRADSGNFVLEMRLPTGTRIEKTTEFAHELDGKIRQWIDPHDLSMIIANAGVYYGYPAAFTPNSGTQDVFFIVDLTEERHHTSQYWVTRVRARLAKEYPGVESGFELGGLLSSALNGGLRAPIDVQVEGPHKHDAIAIAQALAEKMKVLAGAVDVRVQQKIDAPAFQLTIDRKKAAAIGLTTDEIVKNVASAVSGSATFKPSIWIDPKTGIDYFVTLEFPEAKVSTVEDLARVPIMGAGQDRSVPLSRVAAITELKVPSEVNHLNLNPVIDIWANAEGRDVGGLSRDIERLIDKTELPKGYSIHIRGEISEMQRAVQSLGGGFLLAAIMVYLILVVQFESFVLPLIMMMAVPLGIVGVILMLAATRTYFSIQAAIGAIFMIGIAVANGVLLIEFIQHHLGDHGVKDAILHGASARLRPILMTALASVLGLVPMAVGMGHGSEANIPLGRAVIGGQLLSTALTLFVVPVLFSLVQGRRSDNKSGGK